MKRIDKRLFLKSVVRTAVDGCFLPGTMMGTELMLLWVIKMKKEISTVALAVMSIMFANFDVTSTTTTLITRQSSEQDS